MMTCVWHVLLKWRWVQHDLTTKMFTWERSLRILIVCFDVAYITWGKCRRVLWFIRLTWRHRRTREVFQDNAIFSGIVRALIAWATDTRNKSRDPEKWHIKASRHRDLEENESLPKIRRFGHFAFLPSSSVTMDVKIVSRNFEVLEQSTNNLWILTAIQSYLCWSQNFRELHGDSRLWDAEAQFPEKSQRPKHWNLRLQYVHKSHVWAVCPQPGLI